MATNITADSLLDRVKAIAPISREYAAEAEEKRRLSRPVVDAMLQAGLYNMAHPKVFGGLEVDPLTMFRVVEEIARHDSAAGWNLQLAVAASYFPAWLPDEGAAEIMHGHPNTIIAGSFTPGRQAIPVDGGYRLRGQWPFVSGSHDAHWFLFLPQIMDGDQPRLNDQGDPVQRLMFLPVDKANILDTWHTLGMRGTGSDDVAVSDLFIPERHTALLAPLEKPGTAYQGPLYRLTVWVPVVLLAPPALGIARAAIDDLIALARTKTPSYTGSSLAQRQVVQRQVAEAEATLGAGRAYLYTTFQETWDAVVQGRGDHPGSEADDAASDLPCHRVRSQGGRARPCRGWHVVHPQRVQVPEVLQGRTHDHAARLRFGKSLRVSRSPDAWGGVRLGLL
jgi:alkylation response protein AidB-like acyl-CoA dehydrogenase